MQLEENNTTVLLSKVFGTEKVVIEMCVPRTAARARPAAAADRADGRPRDHFSGTPRTTTRRTRTRTTSSLTTTSSMGRRAPTGPRPPTASRRTATTTSTTTSSTTRGWTRWSSS